MIRSPVLLKERLSYKQAKMITESIAEGEDNSKKSLYMKGIFIEGDVLNQNNRIYSKHEIHKAVNMINEKINDGYTVVGEADHPADLNINIDRISHMITEMNIDGVNGIGKLKILETPMGRIIKTLLEADVKLGVSSRGSGNVGSDGMVNDFEIITVDIVINPSAPDAYPEPIYEQIMNHCRGNILMDVATSVGHDHRAQNYFTNEIVNTIKTLKYRRD